ncbi:hypothetical protein Tco_0046229 [Tanacetum coccineum]
MVAYLKKIEGSEGFHQIVDFLNTSHIRYALTENPTIYVSLIQQFWQTATASTLDNGEIEITATIDGKVKIVTKASQGEGSTHPVESHHTPTSAPPTSQPPISSTSRRITRQESVVPQPRSPTQTNVADEAASTGVDVRLGGATTTVTGLEAGYGSGNIDKTPAMPHDSPLPRGRHEHDMESDFKFTVAEEVYTTKKGVSTTKPISTVGASVSTASASSAKDKGKAIIEEARTIQTKTKLQQEQERLKWEDIQARIKADEELAQRLQAEEREKYSETKKARLLAELINQRKRHFAQQRAKERRNKPPTQAQQRTYMSNYIKHMGSYTLQQLRGYSFDEIKSLFEATMKRVNTFTPMESDVDKTVAGSSKRDAEKELGQESSKTQKIGESSQQAKEPDELSQEELQQLMIIVPEEGMNIEALQTKYPIIDWEVYTKDSRMYWKIIRVGNHTEVYQVFEDMLKTFDRDDLVKLWSLVQERFNSTEPTEDKEIEIWVELKRLFEPDADDELWKSQKHIHDVTWRLYDTCGVHHVSTKDGMDIYMLVEREYPLSRGVLTQMLVAKLLVEQDNEMSRELLRKIFMQVERPRR